MAEHLFISEALARRTIHDQHTDLRSNAAGLVEATEAALAAVATLNWDGPPPAARLAHRTSLRTALDEIANTPTMAEEPHSALMKLRRRNTAFAKKKNAKKRTEYAKQKQMRSDRSGTDSQASQQNSQNTSPATSGTTTPRGAGETENSTRATSETTTPQSGAMEADSGYLERQAAILRGEPGA